jgi:hypothetical protein
MTDHGFIDAVSGIVNRGCHDPPCATGAVDGAHERSHNFNKVLDTLLHGAPQAVSVQYANENSNWSEHYSGVNPMAISPDTTPAHQVLPPVMFTPEVDHILGHSGSSSQASPTSVTPSTVAVLSASDESLEPSINHPGNAEAESIVSNMFTQDQIEYPGLLDGSHTAPQNTQDPETDSNVPNDLSTESQEASHDSQTPTSLVVYSCKDDADPRLNSLSMDIPFEYEAYISSKANQIEAMKDLKYKIFRDVGSSLGCTISSSKRRLRYAAEFEVISGFQSIINSHSDVSTRCDASIYDETVICLSAMSYLTAFVNHNSPDNDVEESKRLILSIIEDGMRNGNYISDDVRQVVFTSKGDEPPTFDSIQSSKMESNDHTSTDSPAWIPIVVTLLMLAVVALNVAFIRRYKRRNSSAKVQSDPKTLAAFVSTLEGVPTPKMDSVNSDSSESIDESQLDCFDELNAPPFDKENDSSVSDYFSRESGSEGEVAANDSSNDMLVVYVSSEHSSQ